MPPSRARKDPSKVKEAVVYPASKRKATPFIPQRPRKVGRVAEAGLGDDGGRGGSGAGDGFGGSGGASTGGGGDGDREGSVETRMSGRIRGVGGRNKGQRVGASAGKKVTGGGEFRKASALGGNGVGSGEDGDSDSVISGVSDGELDDDPLAGMYEVGKKSVKSVVNTDAPTTSVKAVAAKGTQRPLTSPDLDISSSPPALPKPQREIAVPPLSQAEEIPTISQPLLLRLLHEGFADKSTKIDKHAIQVLQKYMEVFMREAIARAALSKREAAERGEADEADKAWLELEDLEKIAPGMLLDF